MASIPQNKRFQKLMPNQEQDETVQKQNATPIAPGGASQPNIQQPIKIGQPGGQQQPVKRGYEAGFQGRPGHPARPIPNKMPGGAIPPNYRPGPIRPSQDGFPGNNYRPIKPIQRPQPINKGPNMDQYMGRPSRVGERSQIGTSRIGNDGQEMYLADIGSSSGFRNRLNWAKENPGVPYKSNRPVTQDIAEHWVNADEFNLLHGMDPASYMNRPIEPPSGKRKLYGKDRLGTVGYSEMPRERGESLRGDFVDQLARLRNGIQEPQNPRNPNNSYRQAASEYQSLMQDKDLWKDVEVPSVQRPESFGKYQQQKSVIEENIRNQLLQKYPPEVVEKIIQMQRMNRVQPK